MGILAGRDCSSILRRSNGIDESRASPALVQSRASILKSYSAGRSLLRKRRGFVWLQQWEVGVPELVRPGWKIIEDIRRANGDLRSLDIAPAQLFRHDEFVELHAFLIQVMAYGWGAYFVPRVGGYFLDFRTSERFFCKAKSAQKLEELYSVLEEWGPLRNNAETRKPRPAQ